LKRRFLFGPCKGIVRKTVGETKLVPYRTDKEAAGREPPFREDFSPEVEE
jgi:hypothetical protein